jgi:hypothetical protein
MMLEMPFRGNKHILSEQAAEKRVHLFSSERCKNSSGYVCNDGGWLDLTVGGIVTHEL